MDYAEYKKLGGKNDISAYTSIYPYAKAKLDYYTMGRVNQISGNAAIAMTMLIDVLADNPRNVKSMSNDGVSITFEKTNEQRIYEIIKTLLPDESYRGFYVVE